MRRVVVFVEERKALVGIDSGVIRATEPRALASLDNKNLADVVLEIRDGNRIGDGAANVFEVLPIEISVGERIDEACFDQNRAVGGRIGVIQEIEIIAILRTAIDESTSVRDLKRRLQPALNVRVTVDVRFGETLRRSRSALGSCEKARAALACAGQSSKQRRAVGTSPIRVARASRAQWRARSRCEILRHCRPMPEMVRSTAR
jgi:hypothetical protein